MSEDKKFQIGDRVVVKNPASGLGRGTVTAIAQAYEVTWDGWSKPAFGYRDEIELAPPEPATLLEAAEYLLASLITDSAGANPTAIVLLRAAVEREKP